MSVGAQLSDDWRCYLFQLASRLEQIPGMIRQFGVHGLETVKDCQQQLRLTAKSERKIRLKVPNAPGLATFCLNQWTTECNDANVRDRLNTIRDELASLAKWKSPTTLPGDLNSICVQFCGHADALKTLASSGAELGEVSRHRRWQSRLRPLVTELHRILSLIECVGVSINVRRTASQLASRHVQENQKIVRVASQETVSELMWAWRAEIGWRPWPLRHDMLDILERIHVLLRVSLGMYGETHHSEFPPEYPVDLGTICDGLRSAAEYIKTFNSGDLSSRARPERLPSPCDRVEFDESTSDEQSATETRSFGPFKFSIRRDPATGRALIDREKEEVREHSTVPALKLEPQDQAMALLAKYGTEWTVASYAKALGVNRTAMYKGRHKRWAKFFDALAIARRSGNVPRGTKSKNGTVEAIDDD